MSFDSLPQHFQIRTRAERQLHDQLQVLELLYNRSGRPFTQKQALHVGITDNELTNFLERGWFILDSNGNYDFTQAALQLIDTTQRVTPQTSEGSTESLADRLLKLWQMMKSVFRGCYSPRIERENALENFEVMQNQGNEHSQRQVVSNERFWSIGKGVCKLVVYAEGDANHSDSDYAAQEVADLLRKFVKSGLANYEGEENVAIVDILRESVKQANLVYRSKAKGEGFVEESIPRVSISLSLLLPSIAMQSGESSSAERIFTVQVGKASEIFLYNREGAMVERVNERHQYNDMLASHKRLGEADLGNQTDDLFSTGTGTFPRGYRMLFASPGIKVPDQYPADRWSNLRQATSEIVRVSAKENFSSGNKPNLTAAILQG